MSDHHTERDRPAPAGAPRRNDDPVPSVAAVAIAVLCGCLLSIAVVPAAGGVGGDQPGDAEDTAVEDNRTAPGGELARTVVTHEARLGASFEASVLEEDLERHRSDRARARRLAQFETGLVAALAALQQRHATVVDRLHRGETDAPAVRTDLTRTEAQARAVGELAQRADASVESLSENATRDADVHPDDFDRHAESSESIAGNESDRLDRRDRDRSDGGSEFLIGHDDGADASGDGQRPQCGRWTGLWTTRHDPSRGIESNDCDDGSTTPAHGDRVSNETAGPAAEVTRGQTPGFGFWQFGPDDWSANGSIDQDYGEHADGGHPGVEPGDDRADDSRHYQWADGSDGVDGTETQHGWDPDGDEERAPSESVWNDEPASSDDAFGGDYGGFGDDERFDDGDGFTDSGSVTDDGGYRGDSDHQDDESADHSRFDHGWSEGGWSDDGSSDDGDNESGELDDGSVSEDDSEWDGGFEDGSEFDGAFATDDGVREDDASGSGGTDGGFDEGGSFGEYEDGSDSVDGSGDFDDPYDGSDDDDSFDEDATSDGW